MPTAERLTAARLKSTTIQAAETRVRKCHFCPTFPLERAIPLTAGTQKAMAAETIISIFIGDFGIIAR